jgi:hypothetical protein
MAKFSLDLDYSSLDSDDFDNIAHILLNRSCLYVSNTPYRLVEIEFYLYNENHPDSYVHCDDDQMLKNKFYFHKFKNGTYKSGTFKGMDLTFGDAETETYFGILIRAIINTETDEIIEGPCNVVNHILKSYELDSIADLTGNKVLSIRHNSMNFILRNKKFKKENIATGPRIGLSARYPDYQTVPYRYVIFKDRIKKQKSKLK